MGFGTTGAIGNALSALGQGVSDMGQRDYNEQLRLRVEASKTARDKTISNLKSGYEKKLTKAQAKLAAATQKPKKTMKEDFLGDVEIDGKKYNDVQLSLTHDPSSTKGKVKGFPNYTVSNINPLNTKAKGQGKAWDRSRQVAKDYFSASSDLTDKEILANDILNLLSKKDRTAIIDLATYNKFAALLSNASNSIKEPDKYEGKGDLIQRLTGAVKNFTLGVRNNTQYKDMEKLIGIYASEVLPFEKKLIDDQYTRTFESIPDKGGYNWELRPSNIQELNLESYREAKANREQYAIDNENKKSNAQKMREQGRKSRRDSRKTTISATLASKINDNFTVAPPVGLDSRPDMPPTLNEINSPIAVRRQVDRRNRRIANTPIENTAANAMLGLVKPDSETTLQRPKNAREVQQFGESMGFKQEWIDDAKRGYGFAVEETKDALEDYFNDFTAQDSAGVN